LLLRLHRSASESHRPLGQSRRIYPRPIAQTDVQEVRQLFLYGTNPFYLSVSDEYHPLLPSFIRLQGPSAEGASCASRDTSMHNRLNKPVNLECPLLASFTRKPHTEFHFVIWHIFCRINKCLNLAILTKSVCSRALQSLQPDNPNKASRERQF